MRTRFTDRILVLFFGAALGAVLLSSPGCSMFKSDTAPTKEAVAFRTFQDTWAISHAAYAAYCERVVQGKVTRADELNADRLWNRFRATFKTALVAASQNWNAPPPENVKSLSAELVATLKPR